MGVVAFVTIGFFAFVTSRIAAPRLRPALRRPRAQGQRPDRPEARRHERALPGPRRRLADPGARRPSGEAAHADGRGRPAARRLGRLRDLRQDGQLRHLELRPEHQPCAGARRRAGAHHLVDQPRAERPRPSGPAAARAVLAREAGAVRLDRRQAARRRAARQGAGRGDPAPRGRRDRRPAAVARLGRRHRRQSAGARRRRHRGRASPGRPSTSGASITRPVSSATSRS